MRHQNNDSILLAIICTDKFVGELWQAFSSLFLSIYFQFEYQTKRWYWKLYSPPPETNLRFTFRTKKFLSCWVTFLRLWKRVLYHVAQVLQKQAIQFIWHAILTCFCFWSVKHAGLFEDRADIVSKLLARAYGGNLGYNHTVWNPRILLMLIYQTFKKLFGPTSSSQKSKQTWVGSYWLAIAILQGVQ